MNNRLTSLLLIVSVVLCCMVSRSCANTTTPPSGGDKDTIPPVLLKVTPESGTTLFKTFGQDVHLTFNEYTVVKQQNEVYLSPPSKKKPQVKVKGKDIVVTFRDTLRENTTYTIDFGEALVDNNEGNKAPRYVYTFSTGDIIDSLYLTGTVLDCETLLPVKGMLVGIYTSKADSVCINEYPDAASRTDDWGFFAIRNVKGDSCRIYAILDEDYDSKYNLGVEKIAFLDSMIVPRKVVRDSIFELQSFDMKDTLGCQSRQSDYTLLAFKEYMSKQYIKNKGRIDEKMGFVTFSAPNVEVESFQIMGVDTTDIITQYNLTRDSMNYWIDCNYPLEDSLLLKVRYMKTDSLGVDVMTDEDIAVALPKRNITPEMKEKMAADTLLKLNLEAEPTKVEQDGITLKFDYPISRYCTDSIRFIVTNTRNQIDTVGFTLERSKEDIRWYNINPDVPYKVGFKYKLELAENAFFDLNGKKNAKASKEISLPNDEMMSTIILNVHGAEGRYLVELVDDSRKNVFRKYEISGPCKLTFPYLKAGKYSFRITEDKNGNGIFDTGNMLKNIQPEKVTLLKLKDGTEILELMEQTEIEQDLFL